MQRILFTGLVIIVLAFQSSLAVDLNNVIISQQGNGTFNQNGGSNHADYLAISKCDSGVCDPGTYNLSAGDLVVNNMDIATSGGSGFQGTGIFNQSGGSVLIREQLNLAADVEFNGTYSLSGGSLEVGELGMFGPGDTGAMGVFNQTGGTVVTTRVFDQGRLSAGSNFTYNLSAGSLVTKTIEFQETVVGQTASRFNFNGGRLAVDKFVGSLVNKGGILAPGRSPGTTEITGSYTQDSSAALEIEIGGLEQGVQYDWLNVNQTASLAGTLDVSLFNLGSGSFTLGEGDVFDILSAESISGKFDQLKLVNLSDGLEWNVSYLKDAKGNTDVVRLTVEASEEVVENLPPKANAGSNQTVNEGEVVNLNGILSLDNDGSITAYEWTQTSGTTTSLSGATTATASFIAPAVTSDTTLVFSLVVIDDKGDTDTASVTVTVKNGVIAGNGLVASAGVDQQVTEGDNVQLNALNSVSIGESIESYRWQQTEGPDVQLGFNNNATLSFTAPATDLSSPELLVFKLTVTGSSGAKDSDTVLVNVRDTLLTSIAPALDIQLLDRVAPANSLYQFATTIDPFVNSVAIQWAQIDGPSVTLNNATDAVPSFSTPDLTADSTLMFEVRSTSADGVVVRSFVNVNVLSPSSANLAPVANAGVDQVVTEGSTVNLDASASSDSGGSIVGYYWRQTGGPMVLVSSTTIAQPSFVAPAIDAPTTLIFEVMVTDNGGFVDRQSVAINVLDDGVVDAADGVTTIISSTGDRIGIKAISGGSLIALGVSDQDLNVILDEANAPGFLPYGLLDFSLRVEPGSTVQVSIVLPSPAAADMTWWKYSNGEWLDYSDNTSFNAARDVVTITLIDNDIGDDDPTPGVIRDPGGLGQASASAADPAAGVGGSASPLLLAFLLLFYFVRQITFRRQGRIHF